MKTCLVCRNSLPLTEYHKNYKGKDGHQSRCKKCAIEKMAQYQRENKERVNEKNKQWKREHKDEVREAFRKYRASLPAEVRNAKYRKHDLWRHFKMTVAE